MMMHSRSESSRTSSRTSSSREENLFKLVDGAPSPTSVEKRGLFASFKKKVMKGRRSMGKEFEHQALAGPSYSAESEKTGSENDDGWHFESRDDWAFDDYKDSPRDGGEVFGDHRDEMGFPSIPPTARDLIESPRPEKQTRHLNPKLTLSKTKRRLECKRPKDFSLTQMISQSFDSENGSHSARSNRREAPDMFAIDGQMSFSAHEPSTEYAQFNISGGEPRVTQHDIVTELNLSCNSSYNYGQTQTCSDEEKKSREQPKRNEEETLDDTSLAQLSIESSAERTEDATEVQGVSSPVPVDPGIPSFKDRLAFYNSNSKLNLTTQNSFSQRGEEASLSKREHYGSIDGDRHEKANITDAEVEARKNEDEDQECPHDSPICVSAKECAPPPPLIDTDHAAEESSIQNKIKRFQDGSNHGLTVLNGVVKENDGQQMISDPTKPFGPMKLVIGGRTMSYVPVTSFPQGDCHISSSRHSFSSAKRVSTSSYQSIESKKSPFMSKPSNRFSFIKGETMNKQTQIASPRPTVAQRKASFLPRSSFESAEIINRGSIGDNCTSAQTGVASNISELEAAFSRRSLCKGNNSSTNSSQPQTKESRDNTDHFDGTRVKAFRRCLEETAGNNMDKAERQQPLEKVQVSESDNVNRARLSIADRKKALSERFLSSITSNDNNTAVKPAAEVNEIGNDPPTHENRTVSTCNRKSKVLSIRKESAAAKLSTPVEQVEKIKKPSFTLSSKVSRNRVLNLSASDPILNNIRQSSLILDEKTAMGPSGVKNMMMAADREGNGHQSSSGRSDDSSRNGIMSVSERKKFLSSCFLIQSSQDESDFESTMLPPEYLNVPKWKKNALSRTESFTQPMESNAGGKDTVTISNAHNAHRSRSTVAQDGNESCNTAVNHYHRPAVYDPLDNSKTASTEKAVSAMQASVASWVKPRILSSKTTQTSFEHIDSSNSGEKVQNTATDLKESTQGSKGESAGSSKDSFTSRLHFFQQQDCTIPVKEDQKTSFLDEPSLSSIHIDMTEPDLESQSHPLYVTVDKSCNALDCWSPNPSLNGERKVVCEPEAYPTGKPYLDGGLRTSQERSPFGEATQNTIERYHAVKNRFSQKSLPWRQKNAADKYLERSKQTGPCSMETPERLESSARLPMPIRNSELFCPISNSPAIHERRSSPQASPPIPSGVPQNSSLKLRSPFGTPQNGYEY